MTVKQALSYTGNEYNEMNYEELAEVTRALAEAARKRISRLKEGPAYIKLKRQAIGSGRTAKVSALSYRDDKIKISQRFKGKNRMSLNELRQLRKSLYNYLQDDTSTIKGYNEIHEKAQEMLKQRANNKNIKDIQDAWLGDMNEWDVFDEYLADDDLITFGKNHLDWSSDQIYNVIIESGGYKARDSVDTTVNARFKRRLKQHTALELYKKVGSRTKDESGRHISLLSVIEEETAKPMPKFFY